MGKKFPGAVPVHWPGGEGPAGSALTVRAAVGVEVAKTSTCPVLAARLYEARVTEQGSAGCR